MISKYFRTCILIFLIVLFNIDFVYIEYYYKPVQRIKRDICSKFFDLFRFISLFIERYPNGEYISCSILLLPIDGANLHAKNSFNQIRYQTKSYFCRFIVSFLSSRSAVMSPMSPHLPMKNFSRLSTKMPPNRIKNRQCQTA